MKSSPSVPRAVLASALDDYVAKISRLIRRRAGQRAYTEITVVIQDGNPVRVKECRQAILEEFSPEQF